MGCIICGGREEGQLVGTETFRVRKCRSCGLLRLVVPGDPEWVIDYTKNLNFAAYERQMRPFREKQFGRELPKLLGYVRGRRLLDIGCAAGWFLLAASRAGFRPTGLEPQAKLARSARRLVPGVEVIAGVADSPRLRRRSFEAVTLWSVVEHFADPIGELTRIGRLLLPGGVLALRTPNSAGPLAWGSLWVYRLTGGRFRLPLLSLWQLETDSYHWYLYNPWNLRRMIEGAGMTVIDWYTSPNLDRRNLAGWLSGKRRRWPRLLVWPLQLLLLVEEAGSLVLGRGDDIVLFARKPDRVGDG